MKKNIFLALFVLIFSACTINEYETNDPEYYSEVFEVSIRNWKPVYDRDRLWYYYCTFDLPLSRETIEYKPIDVYYETPKEAFLTPLPYSAFHVDDNNYQWEEQLTVEYEPGCITFILKCDDQSDELPFYDYYRFLVKFPL
jgi:hypothetical protein